MCSWTESGEANQQPQRITSFCYINSVKQKARRRKSGAAQATNNRFTRTGQHFLIKKKNNTENFVLHSHLPSEFCDYTALHLGSSQRRDRLKFPLAEGGKAVLATCKTGRIILHNNITAHEANTGSDLLE